MAIHTQKGTMVWWVLGKAHWAYKDHTEKDTWEDFHITDCLTDHCS